MEDKNKQMRGADIIISICFLVLGVAMLVGALRMPLADSYGGVDSVWYVSPALLPIIIAIAIILLSISILVNALKNGGKEILKEGFRKLKTRKFTDDENMRFIAIIVPLVAVVFISLERMDFFFAIFLFLYFTIAVFYFDNPTLRRKLLLTYSVMMGLNAILAITGLDSMLKSVFIYSFDVIALVESVILVVRVKRLTKKEDQREILKKQSRTVFLVSILVPLFIEIAFRFGLRVPMPFEGSVMNLMYLVYYALR